MGLNSKEHASSERVRKFLTACIKHEISQAFSSRRHTMMVKKKMYKKGAIRVKLLFCSILTLLLFDVLVTVAVVES